MAEKKASVVAEKKASIVAGKKVSVAVAAAEALGVTGDPTSALNLTPEEALAAEQAQERMDIRAMPVRQYLEKSVVPLLLHGLQLLAIERPENPVAFLAHYLIENNPRNKKNPLKEEQKEVKKEE
ncbi:hypothetical protein KC19_11G067600 [Ceratodon purpureus]|uniref:Protein dpy-30 homolog n=1 Tax=Ceratodon purpureus TaxID=3225 RepID=A0A8T0GBS2_CERPU|nr:hypothetical protein KC19_11G067600 [Ceratodon purpureus]KAG0556622.1 hypothetical protein KC19_11G067600 [Ceratodon purpureus]